MHPCTEVQSNESIIYCLRSEIGKAPGGGALPTPLLRAAIKGDYYNKPLLINNLTYYIHEEYLSLLLGAATVASASAAITVDKQDLTHALIYSGHCEIDINNDGILDLIYSGEVREQTSGRLIEDSEGNETQIKFNTFQMVWNPATKSYDISEFPYYFANKPYFAVTDWDGDGLTDFFVSGEARNGVDTTQFGLYLNNGDGTFRHQPITVVDEEGSTLEMFDPKCVDFGDFNSDGRMDIVALGYKAYDDGRKDYTGVLINNGDFNFTLTNHHLLSSDGETNYEFALSILKAADLNNDGYCDFLAQGNVDNGDDFRPVKNGAPVGRYFAACLNLGADSYPETQLYDLGLGDGVSHYYGHGDIHVADFNNDGVPDIFVGGESPKDGSAWGPEEFSYNWQLLQGKIAGDKSVSYNDISSQQAFYHKDIRPLNDQNGTRAIDYNGNGLYDLFIPGWCTTMLDNSGNTQAGWFFPNENGSFANFERVPGSSETGVFFTENGVSGERHYGFFGQSWDNTYYSDDEGSEFKTGRMIMFSVNPNQKAARPDAPASAKATVDESGNVALEWTAAATSQPNVTYEYYIYDKGSKKYYTGVPAFVGGDKDGVRTTLAQGRAFMNKNLLLVGMPDGDYEWGVQTVNAGLEGSKFTKGNDFRVGAGAGIQGVLANGNAEVVATEYYDMAGRRVAAAAEGVVIEKTIYADGNVAVSKVVR